MRHIETRVVPQSCPHPGARTCRYPVLTRAVLLGHRETVVAGYSGTPLPQKLGIKAKARVALIDPPAGFVERLGRLPPGVQFVSKFDAGGSPLDVIVLFAIKRSQLEKRFSGVAKRLNPSGGLWVSWPKRASGVKTDVSEDTVRSVALAHGLVDNKVCAIDETWSGLRCVVRLKDRPAAS